MPPLVTPLTIAQLANECSDDDGDVAMMIMMLMMIIIIF